MFRDNKKSTERFLLLKNIIVWKVAITSKLFAVTSLFRLLETARPKKFQRPWGK